MGHEGIMKDRTNTRITLTIFFIVLALGLWLVVKSATAQISAPVCQPGDSTQTCLALLAQKSGQIDSHLSSTDKNVDSIVTDLKNIDNDIAEIKNNEAWERGIWGTIVSLLAGGFIVAHFSRRKQDSN
jgi:predicted PurR-regulated permease PerM